MQGFIINLNRARDEDLVVTILSDQSLDTLYRFYGARHSMINLGFKIDFEINRTINASIGQLRDVVHLGYPWLSNHNRLRYWHQFVSLFYPHLKDAQETGSFYFELLNTSAQRWQTQNPKRVAIEAYSRLLDHEGRLHRTMECFFCETPVGENISLIRSYLPTHPECSHTLSIKRSGLLELFENHSSLFLDDKEVERLWYVMLEGF